MCSMTKDSKLAITVGICSQPNLKQIEALPHIMAEVKDQCPVFLDGGVRDATDIFKALALGAKMVKKLSFISRFNNIIMFLNFFSIVLREYVELMSLLCPL